MSFQKEPENSFYSAVKENCILIIRKYTLIHCWEIAWKINTLMAYRERDDLVEQHYGGHVKVEHEILKNISLII